VQDICVERPVVEIEDLAVGIGHSRALRRPVNGVSLRIGRGERLALVGESGSGKSLTALAVMGLLPRAARIIGGNIRVEGRPVVGMARAAWRELRGSKIGMIFQDPMSALNPVHSVGKQIIEAIRLHRDVSRAAARDLAVELLERVRIPAASRRLEDYPHQFSGGMRQRVMIAMALANRPALIIADEPTTSLDVTTQAQVLALMDEICRADGAGILFISHNLSLVNGFCERVLVMYAGRIVEAGTASEIFDRPYHPYTAGLIASVPPLDEDVDVLRPIPGEPIGAQEEIVGCSFAPRCGLRQERCLKESPRLRELAPRHATACHFGETLAHMGSDNVRNTRPGFPS
jgi:oligopeptide/dipeptide ABC transporter ATP-binding protein